MNTQVLIGAARTLVAGDKGLLVESHLTRRLLGSILRTIATLPSPAR
jgi:hypothetical protein